MGQGRNRKLARAIDKRRRQVAAKGMPYDPARKYRLRMLVEKFDAARLGYRFALEADDRGRR